MDSCFAIKIDGKNIEKDFPIFFIETFVGVNRINYCTIKIQDYLFGNEKLYTNDSKFKIGAKIEVEFGENKDLKNVFTGILSKKSLKFDAREGRCFLEIEAKDKTQQMTLVPQSSTYNDKTDADIVKELISKHGLSAKIGSMNLKHETFVINDITEWDFINLRAEMYGFVVFSQNDTVKVDAPQASSSGLTLTFGQNIIEMNLDLDGNNQIEKSTGKIWDIANQAFKEIPGENVGEKSFGNINYDAITKQNGSAEYNFFHDGTEEPEIKTLSFGLLNINRLAKIHGTITISGNNKAEANKTVKIDKCAENFNGNAYVSGVQHLFCDGDWTTILYIGLNGKRYSHNNNNVFSHGNFDTIAPMHGLKYGTVIKIDGDPKNNFRILVNIPIFYPKGEGVWCRLSTFYASKNGGSIFFPEVNDEVIVGFIEDDPRSPIVLGSLYNAKNPPLIAIDGKNEMKKLTTNSKIEISFDEKDKVVTILTPGECKIMMSDKDESIEISKGSDKISLTKGAVDIKCSKDITINGNNVNIQAKGAIQMKATQDLKMEGMNANLKGSMAANVEGGTAANLKSSGMTAVKGSMVNIN